MSFAYSDSYTDASLENSTWLFENLAVNNYKLSGIQNWCLSISAQNSNVTIKGYSRGELTGMTHAASWLNYTVIGNGTQTIDLHYGYSNYGHPGVQVSCSFSVYINGENRTQGDVWVVLDNGTLIISGTAANINIYYPPNNYLDSAPIPSIDATDQTSSVPQFLILGVLVVVVASLLTNAAIYLKKTTHKRP